MSTYNEQMQACYHQYREEMGIGPTSLRMVADWMIVNGYWKPQPDALRKQCAELLANALRDEFFTDPQGRRVRINHAVRVLVREKGEQGRFWDDIRTATRQHMEMSLQQRRQAIVFDCHQLLIDAASFNDNGGVHDRPIQLSFNFAADLAELDPANLAIVTRPILEPELPAWLSRDSVPGTISSRT